MQTASRSAEIQAAETALVAHFRQMVLARFPTAIKVDASALILVGLCLAAHGGAP
jgi:hypothetical protein